MQVRYFLSGLMFNLLFHYHITLYWENMTSSEKSNHDWKLYGKLQRFNATDGTMKILKNG